MASLRILIAGCIKEPATHVGLKYNGLDVLNEETPLSLGMKHGDILQIFKKDTMRILLKGSFLKDGTQNDPTTTIEIRPETEIGRIKAFIANRVKEEKHKIHLYFNGRWLENTDTPKSLKMLYNDIILASFRKDITVNVYGLGGDFELNHSVMKTLKELKHSYGEMTDKPVDSLVFSYNGIDVDDEDTPESLNMVDKGIIVVTELLTQLLMGEMFEGYIEVTIDPKMKMKNLINHISNGTGIDVKDLVFTIDNQKINDDDTLESFNSNGDKVITVSLIEYIDVNVAFYTSGEEPRTFPSKIRPASLLIEWKSEVSTKLGERIEYLGFKLDNIEIEDNFTPEIINIKEGDILSVYCTSRITIKIVQDDKVLGNHTIHVNQQLRFLAYLYSRTLKVGLNNLKFKFENRELKPTDTAQLVGLKESGIIKVEKKNLMKNEITVEFDLQDEVGEWIYPLPLDFPLLLDVNKTNQIFVLKKWLMKFCGLKDHYLNNEEAWFLNDSTEIYDDETLEEVGLNETDKIFIGINEEAFENKNKTVYVVRNVKETTSCGGNGQTYPHFDKAFNNIKTIRETCAYRIDTSKPLSEFIDKVKAHIKCKSKKDELFLSFNNAIINKEDLGKKLGLNQFNNRFECHAFRTVDAFKRHLEIVRKHEFDTDKKGSDESTKDIQRQLKAIQMRVNQAKKKSKCGETTLAKDIENHKNFENVEDILKFIGEEDVETKTKNVKKDKMESTNKKKKQRNKKQPNTEKDSDTLIEQLVNTGFKVDESIQAEPLEHNMDEFVEPVEKVKSVNDEEDGIKNVPETTPYEKRKQKKEKSSRTISGSRSGKYK